jgi:hypothetical protein
VRATSHRTSAATIRRIIAEWFGRRYAKQRIEVNYILLSKSNHKILQAQPLQIIDVIAHPRHRQKIINTVTYRDAAYGTSGTLYRQRQGQVGLAAILPI